MNYAAAFPACRAVVHHGGAGITTAGLRAGRAHVDPLDVGRSGDVGSSGEKTESRHRPALVGHYREIAGRRPAHYSRPAIRRPGSRDRHSDDQARRKRCDRRRSCGKILLRLGGSALIGRDGTSGSAMKFVLANWGTRGEVEPYVTVGRELVRRGHEVCMAVAPEMVDFVESAGPAGGRLRTGFEGHPGPAPRLLDVFLRQPLENPGTGQVCGAKSRSLSPSAGGRSAGR